MSVALATGTGASSFSTFTSNMSLTVTYDPVADETNEITFSLPIGTVEAGEFTVKDCVVAYADSQPDGEVAIQDHIKHVATEATVEVVEKKAVVKGKFPAVGKEHKKIRCSYNHSNDFKIDASGVSNIDIKEGEKDITVRFDSTSDTQSPFKNPHLSKLDGSAFRAKVNGLENAQFLGVYYNTFVLPTTEKPNMETSFTNKTAKCTLTTTTVSKNEQGEDVRKNAENDLDVICTGSAVKGINLTWDYTVKDGEKVTDVEVHCPELKLQSYSEISSHEASFFAKVDVGDGTFNVFKDVQASGVTGASLAVVIGLAASALAFFM